jgi:hypothetical protein
MSQQRPKRSKATGDRKKANSQKLGLKINPTKEMFIVHRG